MESKANARFILVVKANGCNLDLLGHPVVAHLEIPKSI